MNTIVSRLESGYSICTLCENRQTCAGTHSKRQSKKSLDLKMLLYSWENSIGYNNVICSTTENEGVKLNSYVKTAAVL